MCGITTAFADAMLLIDAAPTPAAKKPKAASIPAIDPVSLQTTCRTGVYPRSPWSFQVISLASLEEVLGETAQEPTIQPAPPTRLGAQWFRGAYDDTLVPGERDERLRPGGRRFHD
jgi:hypothetical protein